MNEYEVELCYKMMAHAYQSSKVDMKPSQVKKIMSLFFDDDVIEAVTIHFLAGTRPTKHAPDVVDSAASVSISPASEVSASEADSTPATTQVM